MSTRFASRRPQEQLQDSRAVSNDFDWSAPSCSQDVNSKLAISCQDLRQLRLFANVSDQGLSALSQTLKLVSFSAGQTICRQNEDGDSMFVVFHGRVKVSCDTEQGERVLRFLDRDEHFGEMSVLTGSRRTANVTAVTNTQLLQIDACEFSGLCKHEPTFAALISETLAVRLACSVRGVTSQSAHRNIAILCGSACGEQLSQQLSDEMLTMGASVKYLRANAATSHPRTRLSVDRRPSNAFPSENELHRLGEQFDRVLLSMSYDEAEQQLELISQCDHILCIVDSATSNAAERSLELLLIRNPKLAARIHCVRILPEGQRFAELTPSMMSSLGRDFKVPFSPGQAASGESATRRGLRRIVRFLFEQRVGIALGGGGARGLAHLGVLRALDDEGIGIDLVSGTSMGAIVGLSYAAGWSPQEAESIFRAELTPGRFLRMVPRGNSWFMLSKFRLGGWESMLRRFFEHATFEQLQIPLCTVTADLQRGGQIIRESGDGVGAILESINLPYISKPILREGCVLVDGGILNNVPIDLLRPRGATTVVGVDVCSHLRQGFGRKSAKQGPVAARHPSMLETALRLNEIRRHHVSRANHRDADQMIWIDTSHFEFEDFSKAHQLAEVGYQAACEVIPRIRQLVDDRFAQSLKVG